jgi:hypothetical protein
MMEFQASMAQGSNLQSAHITDLSDRARWILDPRFVPSSPQRNAAPQQSLDECWPEWEPLAY